MFFVTCYKNSSRVIFERCGFIVLVRSYLKDGPHVSGLVGGAFFYHENHPEEQEGCQRTIFARWYDNERWHTRPSRGRKIRL